LVSPEARRRRRTARTRPRWLIFLLGLALLLAPNLMALPASAEDPAELAIDKQVIGWDDGHQVQPGDTFVYQITITCTNIGSGGCTNAQLTDPLPEGLSLDPNASAISIQPAGAGTASAAGNEVTVDFTQPLTDPAGGQGIQPATTITIDVPVQVDDDISPDLDGQNLTNTASVDADNADKKSGSFIFVPNVPVNLKASTDKSFVPDSSVANPGNTTTMTLTGGNDSNVPVDEIVLTDPTNPPNDAFTYLALTGDLDITLPPGAEQVQVDCYTGGDWVEGEPSTPPAALPGRVDDPADCEGVRVHFISTDGANIAPGASGSIDVGMEQRDNIADAGEGPISNTVSTAVSRDGNPSAPATANDDYTTTSAEIDLDASKNFDPSTIAAGSDSTVTIGATNSSSRTLDSMTITEPGAAPNMFTDGSNPVAFDGFDNPIQPPNGATGASVTYTYSDGTSETLEADSPDTLPGPDSGKTVTGFTVTFTGPIAAGAEASIPSDVTADPDQTVDSLDHPNTINADSTALGGYHGHATADDTLTTLKKRIAIDTGKTVLPSQIFSIPGQQVLVELSAHVEEFPTSTTSANDIVVQEPADLDGDT
jgi:fimbrial isopeptide formation D2 family protein